MARTKGYTSTVGITLKNLLKELGVCAEVSDKEGAIPIQVNKKWLMAYLTEALRSRVNALECPEGCAADKEDNGDEEDEGEKDGGIEFSITSPEGEEW